VRAARFRIRGTVFEICAQLFATTGLRICADRGIFARSPTNCHEAFAPFRLAGVLCRPQAKAIPPAFGRTLRSLGFLCLQELGGMAHFGPDPR